MSLLQPYRELRGGSAAWEEGRVALPPRSTLGRDRECDVLVVGAGVTGAMVAEALSDSGLHVISCDRRVPATGATAASMAMVLHETDTPLASLARRMHREDAERLWRRSFVAVHALRDRVRALGIEAELQERSSVYLQGDLLDAAGLRAEAQARARAGFEVSYLPPAQVQREYGIRGRAALRSGGALAVNPRALAAGFLRAAAARGAELLAPEDITTVEVGRSGVRAATRTGHRIISRNVVLATGHELFRWIPSRGHRVVSSWAIATRRQPRQLWPGPDLIREAGSTGLHLRATADGRVLCAGGNEELSLAAEREALLPAKVLWLQKRLAALLPRVDAQAAQAWSGSFGTMAPGLPAIGEIPGMPHCFAIVGCGGNGLIFSMVAAQMLRNRLAGAGDAELDLLGFRRRR
ncbi:MAG TPA: FAD-binding oxidoreductase [Steroidobacteraceae bacterium]|nr:FAD-binding oxidoreductase [Steroidobacteraceae bacterium]